MKKIILFSIIMLGIAGTAYACSSCGCSNGGKKSHSHSSEEKVCAVGCSCPKCAMRKIADSLMSEESQEIIKVNNKVCPVMNAPIHDDHAILYVYKGKEYRFCCPGCIGEFEKHPDKYIAIIEEELN